MLEVASGTLITMPVPLRDPLNEKRVEVTPLETDFNTQVNKNKGSYQPKFILFMKWSSVKCLKIRPKILEH
ncbi:unnamed protein product [Pocillopora meandrina]|uniref:Uncharacterized protein n=1 Tax=Pocillopora meandrina TaxID=46732 RepID=A0AAU9XB11_9CNID|nr:unnamed protein product [Pocillopora meandrina]